MTFKQFIILSEDQTGSGDNGLMGYAKASSVRKPSDGQPFKNLGSFAGAEPRGNTGGAGPQMGPQMMKKKMKKK